MGKRIREQQVHPFPIRQAHKKITSSAIGMAVVLEVSMLVLECATHMETCYNSGIENRLN